MSELRSAVSIVSCVLGLVAGCGGAGAEQSRLGGGQANENGDGHGTQGSTTATGPSNAASSRGAPPEEVALRPLPPIDASSVQRSTVASWDVSQLFPFQQWPVVVGRRRGLLVSAGAQPWGGSVIWSGGLDTSTDRTEYRFYAEGSSAYAVYFHSPDGRGFNPMGSWRLLDERGATHTMPIAMFLHDTANDWGLHRRAHLVEIDALTPESRANALHFVIRGARVLDGTTEFPLVVEDTLRQLRARFDDEVGGQAGAIDASLAARRSRVPAGYERRAPDGPTVVAFPTWQDDGGALEVVFFARYQEAHLGPERTRMRPCPPCPCDPVAGCAPCALCVPEEETFRDQVNAGYELAVRYRVDREGGLTRETVYALRWL